MKSMKRWSRRCCLAIVVLLGSTTPGMANPTLYPGDVQIVFQGGLEFPNGGLYEEEKELNLVQGRVWYEDGTVKDAELKHEAWQYGFYGEYSLTEQFGVQLGVEFRSVQQRVSAGGGSYEEKTFAEGTLLQFTRPFLGGSFYLYNENDVCVALTGRVGSVLDGKLYPLVTTLDFLSLRPESYTLTGMTVGAGLNVSFIYELFVIGGAFFATNNFFRSSEQIYRDIDQSFSVMSYDLTFYLGLRF